MRISLLVSAIALTFGGPIACADTASTQTTTTSTTTTVKPTSQDYSSSKTELEPNGNVIKKTQTYQSPDPVTGDSSLKSSTTIERPNGTTHTVEIERKTDGLSGQATEVEKRTTTTTSP